MGYGTDVCSLSRGQNFCRVEEESRRLDPRILGAGGSVGVLKRPLMPGVRSKRCRENRGDGDTALRASGGAQRVLLKSTAGLDTQVASCSSSMSVSWVCLRGRLLTA